ncbi:MAG TPA: malonyl-ACP O-methyltransferase BioC [Chromatiaceae bacterium]|jgi:malonyl-CoA O-methyltransferase|nr:malonyl-ACP O-methyltransferase BioC [Chromatiaceae bacterium]HIB83188.1 malonyl-ACP O-methyltransferase BioC [Chromatiaceae bacterium]HIN82222.1 malonyl-[acyl-carrier protein] O-methyltransferase BioC [Chromatiales bacterium]HIO15197.1 malonyl-[acyl-carrier protein] O-methyltransferase BioC [Chromatiales bacterium]HIO54773.1 malonyl-[acyl-carrier protein] O-methyltransferase BioC [Chromatiales bacterium]
MSDPGILIPDKRLVRRSFAASADRYDEVAVMQHEVADRICERLDYVKLQPKVILDVGCGTGRATQALSERYRKAQLIALDLAEPMLNKVRQRQSIWPWQRRTRLLCGDAEQLPIADESVDLVFSSLTIQWCSDIEKTMQEFHRVLRPGGLLMFSTFGPDTLRELSQSWASCDSRPHVNHFIDMHDVGDAAMRAGLADPVMDAEHFTLTYDSVWDLMRDLKAVGAHNVGIDRLHALTGKGRLRQMTQNYEQYRVDNRLPATYEVVYGHAWRTEAPSKSDGIEVQLR